MSNHEFDRGEKVRSRVGLKKRGRLAIGDNESGPCLSLDLMDGGGHEVFGVIHGSMHCRLFTAAPFLWSLSNDLYLYR